MRALVKNNAVEVFRILLEKLKVRFTNVTIDSFKSHPEFPSLTSFSDSLSALGLENVAIRSNYEQLRHELPKPLVVHMFSNGGMFLVVESVTQNEVHFLNESRTTEVFPKEQFLQQWSEIALILEKEGDIKEQEFTSNRIREFFEMCRLPFALISVLLVIMYSTFYVSGRSIFFFAFLITKILGTIISSLLVIQFFDKNNPFIEKVCGPKHSKGNCGSILNSPAAKLFGLISWSEVGFIYFLSGLFYILFSSSNNSHIVTTFIAILAAPYTGYSIFYQWKIAKSWCRLCLFTQAVLFMELVIGILYLISVHSLGVPAKSAFLLTAIVMIVVSIYYLAKPSIAQWLEYKSQFKDLRRIKYDRDVFSTLLNKSRVVDLSSIAPMRFGAVDAQNRITVITNPTCRPCKELNRQLFELLAVKQFLAVDEIFLTENNSNDQSYQLAEFMLRLYEATDSNLRYAVFAEYYLNNTSDASSEWVSKHSNKLIPSALDSKDALLLSHHNWCIENGFYSTPVTLLNGRFLPSGYSVSDLRYLID